MIQFLHHIIVGKMLACNKTERFAAIVTYFVTPCPEIESVVSSDQARSALDEYNSKARTLDIQNLFGTSNMGNEIFVNLCCQRFNVSRMKSRLWPKLKRALGYGLYMEIGRW